MPERNVYRVPEDKVLLRTADVYQTEAQDDVDSYSDKLLAVVADFKNSGRPEGFNAQSMVGKSKRGEVACRLFARIDPDTGIIEAAGFKSRGCLAMTACASVACLLIEGKPIEDALEVSIEDIRECVDDVPPGKVNALHFAVCAIKALVGDFLIREGAQVAELEEATGCSESSISCIMAEHCSLRQSIREMRMDEIEARRAIEINNALACAIDLIRSKTREGKLVNEEDLKLVAPPCLIFQEFEEELISKIDQAPCDATKADLGIDETNEVEASASKPSRFASRGVGVPRLFGHKDVPADEIVQDGSLNAARNGDISDSIAIDDALNNAVPDNEAHGDEISSSDVLSTFDHVFDYSKSDVDDEDFELTPPEGYELIEIDGVWGLVKSDKPTEPKMRDIDASGIKMVEGACDKYFYDADHMSNSFAKLAFLAAEDDPIVTFSYCIRDESKTYPRPMAETSFFNDPISMSKDDVADVWKKIQTLSEYSDIKQISASNGDVYYFSERHLDESYALSIAEWESVERLYNV